MNTAKKLLLAPVVAAIAFVALQSFTASAPTIKCVGPNGECLITLPDGTQVRSTGQAEITPTPADPLPAPELPGKDAVASNL